MTLCVDCAAPTRRRGAALRCAECAATHEAAALRRYREGRVRRKGPAECLDCIQPPLPGHRRCVVHLRYHARYVAEMAEARRAQNLCIDCGRGPTGAYVRCRACLDRRRRY